VSRDDARAGRSGRLPRRVVLSRAFARIVAISSLVTFLVGGCLFSGREECLGIPTKCYQRGENCGDGCAVAPSCNPILCGPLKTSSACDAVTHCVWREHANGCSTLSELPDCFDRTMDTCDSVDGCVWSISCTGTPRGCETYETEARCNRARGCEWHKIPAL
jgi:hypothetical protein